MNEVWIRTDTDQEAVDGLEMAVEQMRLVSVDPSRWKWVILAVHNALTCFMCVTVAGSDQLGAMDERYIKAWRNAYDSDKQLSNDQERKLKRLAEFPELFKRVQSPRWVTGFIDSTPLRPTDEQKMANNEQWL